MPFHDVYAIITLETADLDMPNKVAVLVTDAPAKGAPTMCLSSFKIWHVSDFVLLSL